MEALPVEAATARTGVEAVAATRMPLKELGWP
jgi:hypothetical protein